MKKKLLMIIILVLLLGGAAGAYFFLPKPEKKPVMTNYSPGEYFVTNVKDTNRLLKATVVLVLDTDDKKVLEDVDDRNAEIRDAITTIFRAQELDALQALDLGPVKSEVLKKLNHLLETEHIVGVLFSDWALQ